MTLFRVISKVVASIEASCPKETFDDQVKSTFGDLTTRYFRLGKSSAAPIDYGAPVTHFCYVYKYVAAHADFLSRILKQARLASKDLLFNRKKLRVGCIGGGPGSDIIGLLRYIESNGNEEGIRELDITVFDKEPAWEPVLDAMTANIASDIKVKVRFHQLDALDDGSWSRIDFSEFDLVTSSFFVSEICGTRIGSAAKPFLRHVLSTMKSGALLAYNDNSTDTFHRYFDGIVGAVGGFTTLLSVNEVSMTCMDSKDPIQGYIDRFDHRPKKNGDIGFQGSEENVIEDLFASDIRFTPVPIEDAEVLFMTYMPMDMSDEEIFRRLHSETIWRHEHVVVWGKKHLQPRLTAWYGDPGKSYSYSGTEMHSLPWTNLLLDLRRRVEEFTGAEFNSVLLNLYRDQRDKMGFHSDNERELGPEPVIASLSYGETRTLLFKHKRKKELPLKSVSLTSGSLLLMKGQTQQNWNHGINSETQPCRARINLTFRRIFPKMKDQPRAQKRANTATKREPSRPQEPRLL